MNDSSGALVFWILTPLFVAVGLYLLWYSRRRGKMLEAFARAHQLRIRQDLQGELQKTLDRCFSLREKALVRSFDQLSSIVDGGSARLFRAVELLDLNPHAKAYSTHFARIAAMFDVPTGHDEFFILDSSLQALKKLPAAPSPDPEIVATAKRAAASLNVRHPLSVTLAHGQGLIYFEPLVTGGEKPGDVNALYALAQMLREELAKKKQL